jgi:hypothetical protein
MDEDAILEGSTTSVLLIEERPEKRIVIGVPHHAPAGTADLPCPEHTDADENAGFIGRYIAKALDCCSIIACNYVIDANKSVTTDYATQVARWKPKCLVEIHGHGGKVAKHDVEISSGASANDKYSERLANKLVALFKQIPELKEVSVCGTFSNLYFKASSSVTITDNRWIAYHIELPPKLRKRGKAGRPPTVGYAFCNALVSALRDIHRL